MLLLASKDNKIEFGFIIIYGIFYRRFYDVSQKFNKWDLLGWSENDIMMWKKEIKIIKNVISLTTHIMADINNYGGPSLSLAIIVACCC